MKKPVTLIRKDDGTSTLSVPEEFTSQIITFSYNYLQEEGYFNAEPIDSEGYIPWFTYPSISFLKDILSRNMKVMEYGCGYSSLFFKNRVSELYSVEHDVHWYNVIANKYNVNVKLAEENSVMVPEGDHIIQQCLLRIPPVSTDNVDFDRKHGLLNNSFIGYASQIFNYPKHHFDIIVVDGMARSLCTMLAVDMINPDGYIILDNSDRWHYNFCQRYLFDHGFGRVDFWGPGHYNYHKWCTSFYSKNFKVHNLQVERPVNNNPIYV
jgi:hypothetical protein